MINAREKGAMTKSPFTNKPQSLFVTGGDGLGGAFSFAEILTENGWEEFNPPLPVTMWQHCMVLLNSTTVMVAGGVQGSAVLANTYMISDDNKVTFDKLLIINDN
jgi:hypothetical protein